MTSALSIERRKAFILDIIDDPEVLEKDTRLQKEWEEIWREIIDELGEVLRKGSLSIDHFQEEFPIVGLTFDPRFTAHFNTLHGGLVLECCYLFFHPPFELAGTLVHELEHKLFLEENNMLDSSEDELIEFKRRNMVIAETRAHKKELEFLKKIRPFVEHTWSIYFHLAKQSRKFDISKTIESKENALNRILMTEGKIYDEERQETSLIDSVKVLEKLGIHLNLNSFGDRFLLFDFDFASGRILDYDERTNHMHV